MRRALDLQSECCCDCMVWSLCFWCASCEEARELQFRHVGCTEEFLDKSQEIRVQAWTSGQNVTFSVGDRVMHPHRGPGVVTIVMPDSRRVVNYDSGEVHWYRPGKTQWKFRLAKQDTDCQMFCCCAPVVQTASVNEYLKCGTKELKPGDRICQNERGTGTVVAYTLDRKLEVEYDEAGPENTCIALVAPGNDPQMLKISQFSLCPCATTCIPEPSSVGAIDGHAADDADEQSQLQQQMSQQKAIHADIIPEQDEEEPLEPQTDQQDTSWWNKLRRQRQPELVEYGTEAEVKKAMYSASMNDDYEEAARLKRLLLQFEASDITSDPEKKREELEEALYNAKIEQDYEKAAALQKSIKVLTATIDANNKRQAETFSPDKIGDDAAVASAFLDEIIMRETGGEGPPKVKTKKPKEIDPETGEPVKKKKPKEIDPETGEVIKKKKTKEIDPETGEVIKKKKSKTETIIDPETGEEIVVKKKKPKIDPETGEVVKKKKRPKKVDDDESVESVPQSGQNS